MHFDPKRAAPDLYQKTETAPVKCLQSLGTPLRFLKGIGPARARQLHKLGLSTVEDLLYHLPFRYEDRRAIQQIRNATTGREETFVGKLVALEKQFWRAKRRTILTAVIADGTASLELVWYRPTPYISQRLTKGAWLLVHGKVEKGMFRQRLTHPEFEPVQPGEEGEKARIVPIYLKTEGLPLSTLRRWVAEALDHYGPVLPSFLPGEISKKLDLIDLLTALRQVHQPENTADLDSLNGFASPAHRSIVFDEFFYLQLGLALKRRHRTKQPGISFVRPPGKLIERMRALLPYALTQGQERVLAEIYRSMEAPHPMQRLVQGDVGSGKTILAWLASLRAIENGYQAAWLAPTELLAEQHFANLRGFAERLGLSAAILTGSQPARKRKETMESVAHGNVQFIVGTHALIQEGVRIPRMGLGVIDEQHRFGVIQRMALKNLVPSGSPAGDPDILLMSATPIPRSLAMVLYGDLEVSSLEEMPPGRMPVVTRLFNERSREQAYAWVRKEISTGYQAYIVYPLVEASAKLPLRDATQMAQELKRGYFRDYRVGLVHGQMSTEERERVMRCFKARELDVLVATTVIEVGIDVPDATVMVIEHAERFGLSQLHQLRGRVGRGKGRSHCFLIYGENGGVGGLERLRIMGREHDGFKIAQADLSLRGPGELLGTRQSGLADFRLASLVRDSAILFEARKEALDWLERDPDLTSAASNELKQVLRFRWQERLKLGNTG